MNGDKERRATSAPLDRADERVRHDVGLAGAMRGFLDRVRSGDLGALPVVIGLVIICTAFQSPSPIGFSTTIPP